MGRREKIAQWEKFLTRMDRLFVGKIYKALKGQYERSAELMKEGGSNAVRNYLFSEYINAEIGSVIKEMHVKAGVVIARRTLASLRKMKVKRGGLGFNEEWARDIQDYFRQYLLEKSVFPISATTRARILEVLNRGIEEGLGADEIARQIMNVEQIRGRAKMIVRTETVRAANYGTFLGADKFEFEVEKEWIAANDRRTRRSHNHITGVDGQLREPYARFSNGLLFPGDPSGPASEVINCRCSLAWVPKRDENDNLIPKKPQPRANYVGNLIYTISLGIALTTILNGIENE